MKPTHALYEASRAFLQAAGCDPLEPIGTFTVRSKSRSGRSYEMLHTPDGYAVHQGEGCEGEIFNGPLGCWHSKDFSVAREDVEDHMTQALTTYQPGAIEVRQFNDEDVATLKATICKGASDSELKLFVATCQHTGLDPFLRQIHAVMRNTKVGNDWVPAMTIQIGIDGYRLTARRTGEMQGMDGPQWTYDGGKTWEDMAREEQPVAARCAIWRKGIERPFVAVCRWTAYVQTTSNGNPNSMWARMGPEQLAKCAEALALRRAFPAEMASLPSRPDFVDVDELEMEQQTWALAAGAIEGESRVAEEDGEEPEPGTKGSPADEASSSMRATQQAPSPASPMELLSAIQSAMGLPAKVAAIDVMTRLFDTAVITKLSPDEKADYATILAFRLQDAGHEHEGAYAANGTPVCRLCGDEVQAPAPAEPAAYVAHDVSRGS